MQNVVYNTCGEEKSLLFAEAWGWTFSELGQNIKWVEDLIRNFYNDDEQAVLWSVISIGFLEFNLLFFSHNDGHSGNVMMDDDDLTGESLIFVDFDLTQYGYRAFDWIYHMISASEQLFFDTDGETFFIPNEDIDQWLQLYHKNLVNRSEISDDELDRLWDEFTIHMPYVALGEIWYLV